MNPALKELFIEIKSAIIPHVEAALTDSINKAFEHAEKKIKASSTKYDDVLLVGLEPAKALILSGLKYVFHRPAPVAAQGAKEISSPAV